EAGGQWMDARRMGAIGDGPPRAFLQANARWAKEAKGRRTGLRPYGERNSSCVEGRMNWTNFWKPAPWTAAESRRRTRRRTGLPRGNEKARFRAARDVAVRGKHSRAPQP